MDVLWLCFKSASATRLTSLNTCKHLMFWASDMICSNFPNCVTMLHWGRPSLNPVNIIESQALILCSYIKAQMPNLNQRCLPLFQLCCLFLLQVVLWMPSSICHAFSKNTTSPSFPGLVSSLPWRNHDNPDGCEACLEILKETSPLTIDNDWVPIVNHYFPHHINKHLIKTHLSQN